MVTPEDNSPDPGQPGLWDAPERTRRELAMRMTHIYSLGMTTTSGGNMSVIDGNGNIWITPSGTDKGELTPEDIVCVAPDGTFEGPLKPSMEYPLHREIYSSRPDIRALIHAHPPLLTSFSIVHRTPDTSVVRAWQEICGTVGYATYEMPGSDSIGMKVATEFRKGHDAVIMENHAVVAGGKDLSEALARMETLENCAMTVHTAGFMGELILRDGIQKDLANPETSLHGSPASGELISGSAGEGLSPDEDLVASEISRMAVRACKRGLMYGFCGALSARLQGNSFLMTREGVLRYDIKKTGIIRGGSPGTGPDAWIHTEIYKRFPSVNAVITARPPNLMAFAVTGKEIDVRTIPESWLFLRDLPSVSENANSPGTEAIFRKLASGCPVVIINNDLVLVTGESLLQAFDRLEVAEMTAMSLVMAKTLGTLKPISDNHIEELRKSFPGNEC